MARTMCGTVLTRKAMSTFSFGIPVQVRCIQVSMPMIFWHVLTSSDVRSDVRPPAFLHCHVYVCP